MDRNLNLAHVHEAIAAAVPDRECLVHGARRQRWRDVTDRTRRLGAFLRGRGLGCRREREELAGWESGQDHVALYLYNGCEYLEGMLGAWKARCAPFNVNYRYVDEELLYLLRDADARAVVFHACFAPRLRRLRDALPRVRLWIRVDDGSGEALPGAVDYEEALAASDPEPPPPLSPDDLYILYTGGTTGLPKGVLWRQRDIYAAALGGARPRQCVEEIVARARGGGMRVLPAPPFMHGAAHWAALSFWNAGGTVVVQSQTRRLDPHDIWSTVERERVNALTIVGDAFARPLLEQLGRQRYDLSSLRLLTSGGAILSPGSKGALLERLPGVRILDALGSSESGSQASRTTAAGERALSGDFSVSAGNVVLSEDLAREVEPGSGERGWLARTGVIPLGYLNDAAKTARTFPLVQGRRHAVPGDRATVETDGRIRLLGRDSVTINTGGEKVFAEEVEQALKAHPAVWDALVVGTPHPRFGQQVTALVALRSGMAADAGALRAEVSRHLADYKAPRVVLFVPEVLRAPSGKADYAWARGQAARLLGGAEGDGSDG